MIDILEHIANKKFNKKYLLDKPKGVKEEIVIIH